jgi:hypothetical protein
MSKKMGLTPFFFCGSSFIESISMTNKETRPETDPLAVPLIHHAIIFKNPALAIRLIDLSGKSGADRSGNEYVIYSPIPELTIVIISPSPERLVGLVWFFLLRL